MAVGRVKDLQQQQQAAWMLFCRCPAPHKQQQRRRPLLMGLLLVVT
jgi:hypothetical protein